MNGPESVIAPDVKGAPLPKVLNHTAYPSQYYQMMDVNDDVFHVMVSRLTYDMTKVDDEGHLLLADEQAALITTDEYYEEVNTSSVVQESDFAPYKPKCDILFAHAVAYAPEGKPSKSWPIGVKVGDWEKRLTVVGPRRMERLLGTWSIGSTEAVEHVPIRYELAYGGTCQWPLAISEDQAHELYEYHKTNPIGSGFSRRAWRKKSGVDYAYAPSIEAFETPFSAKNADNEDYPAVGLGPVGRWWQPRASLAGTYDAEWKATRWPKLPLDFDFAYWNAAPKDQQIDYPQGGEDVVLIGLHPQGTLRFKLPVPDIKLLLRLEAGVPLFKPMETDTLIFDMQQLTVSVVRRGLVAAKAGIKQVELGTWDIEAARAKNAELIKQA